MPGEVNESYSDEDDVDDPVCGWPTGDDSPCQNPAGEDGTCWIDSHGDPDADNPHGAPEGNDNAVGNPGGGAPEGNFNALKTGKWLAAKRRLQFIIDKSGQEEAQRFADYFIQEVEAGAPPNAALKIATALVFSEKLEEELIEDGFYRPLYHEGEKVAEVLSDRHFDAMTSLWREARLHRRDSGAGGGGSGAGSGHSNKDQLIDSGAWGQ